MKSEMRYLVVIDSDQKRLRREFDDQRIHYGRSQKTHQFEVWYTPNSSRPYKIAICINVCHAIVQLNNRQKADKMRAKDLLREIDDHNDKLTESVHADAMHAIKADLRNVACGRQLYT